MKFSKIFARLRILYFITDPSVVKKFTDEILCDEYDLF